MGDAQEASASAKQSARTRRVMGRKGLNEREAKTATDETTDLALRSAQISSCLCLTNKRSRGGGDVAGDSGLRSSALATAWQ